MSERRSTGDLPEAAAMLIACDGSPHAEEAIRAATAMMPGRRALLLTVWGSVWQAAAATRIALPDDLVAEGVAALDAEAQDEASRTAEDGARLARAGGLRAAAMEAVRRGSVAATIAAVADAHDASAVVAGHAVGRVTYGLLHATRRPILVARDGSATERPAPDGPVMLCYDGSAPARRAGEVAGRLLRGSRGLVVHCWQPADDRSLLRSAAHPIVVPQLRDLVAKLNDAHREQAETVAAEGADVARSAGFEATPRIVGEREGIWETLSGVAEDEDARLVVAGSRGRSSWSSLVIGSVSHGLLHHSGRPLLIVAPPEEPGHRS
jgi:nucleotide-binding universal stress UspA family protein